MSQADREKHQRQDERLCDCAYRLRHSFSSVRPSGRSQVYRIAPRRDKPREALLARAAGKLRPSDGAAPAGRSLPALLPNARAGGAEEIRTPDLRRAKAALSQLSYGPTVLVGHSGFEPETSVLSGLRSNHLS